MTVQSPADFGIIVALDLELQAVLRQLGNYERVEDSTKDVRTYYVGTFPTASGAPYKIVVTSPLQAGNTTAALATKDLIDRWSPAHILMIGIAAGLQPKEQSLGDVIVAESILYYELAKVRSSGTEIRPVSFPSPALLVSKAKSLPPTGWEKRIDVERPTAGCETKGPRIHIGPMATGEKVLSDRAYIEKLLGLHSKLVGAEMESFGVASAAYLALPSPGFLTIRGISDFGDSNKSDDWQDYAACSAAAWAFEYLASGPIPPQQRETVKGPISIPRGKPITLRWKGVKGRKFSVKVSEQNTQKSVTSGGPIPPAIEILKTIVSRQFQATMVNVSSSGLITVRLDPLTARMERVLPGSKVFTEGVRRSVGETPMIRSGVVYGEATQSDLTFLETMSKELTGATIGLEITPRGTVVKRSVSGAPFLSELPEGLDPTAEFQLQQMQWMSGEKDLASWIASTAILHFPEESVSVGDSWKVRRRLDFVSSRYEGLSSAILEEVEGGDGGGIARIREEILMNCDMEQMGRIQEATFMAQFPTVEARSRPGGTGTLKMDSEWVFDIGEGELISRSCDTMAMKIQSSMDIHDPVEPYTSQTEVETSASFSIECSRLE